MKWKWYFGFGIAVIGITIIAFTIPEKKNNDRYQKGWEKLKQIDGQAGEAVVESLADISPEFGTYIIEYVFGDVYSRTSISDKEREVAVISALTALGNATPQLKVHLHAALNTGCSAEEVVQIINQTAPYGGIPASLNALSTFREVLRDREVKYVPGPLNELSYNEILQYGISKLDKIQDHQYDKLKGSLKDIAPDMTEHITFTYGRLINEEALDQKLRIIATIASLTAKGTARPQLKLYIKSALHCGIPPEKIREVMITMSVYSGFPSALNGMFLLKDVLQEQGIQIQNS